MGVLSSYGKDLEDHFLEHKKVFFSLVFRPPFEYLTIWQSDTKLQFEYQTSPVFRWLLYCYDQSCVKCDVGNIDPNICFLEIFRRGQGAGSDPKRREEDAVGGPVSPGPQQQDLHPHLSKFVKTLPSFPDNYAVGGGGGGTDSVL